MAQKGMNMGFLEILTLIFVVLKATEVPAFADWSWWWVFSPLWIGYGAVLLFALVTTTVAVVSGKPTPRFPRR